MKLLSVRHIKAPSCTRERLVLVVGAFIYALLFALCSQIDRTGSTQLSVSVFRFVLAFPAALAVLSALFCVLLPVCRIRKSAAQAAGRFCTPLAFAVLVLAYIPMFLIQYPGSYTYDINAQAYQAATGDFSTHHPLLHTLFLRACLNTMSLTGSIEKGAALCTIIQLLLVSLLFSLVCSSISRSFSRRAGRAALLFFLLHPAHMAFASAFTKDVLFSAAFALFIALCTEEMLGGLSGLHRGLQLLCGVLACMLRNNMIYALAVWFVLLLLTGRRFARTALCALMIIVLSFGADRALMAATQAQKGSVREMLSVPAQQFARVRVFAPDQLTQEETEQMDALFDNVHFDRYDPTLADSIKDRIDDEAFLRDPLGAARLWLSIGQKHPGLYLDAFLHTALPALYPYSEYKGSADYIEVGECRDVLTKYYALEPLVQPRRFAGIRAWLNDEIYKTGADHHPLLRYLFNTGFLFWLLLLQVLYAVYGGHWRRFTVMLLPVLLWGTYLLGPVMQGRYAYPFLCILPLFLLLSLYSPQPLPAHGTGIDANGE